MTTKTTSYFIDDVSDLHLAKQGQVWTIGTATRRGLVDLEFLDGTAAAIIEFLSDAEEPNLSDTGIDPYTMTPAMTATLVRSALGRYGTPMKRTVRGDWLRALGDCLIAAGDRWDEGTR